MHKYRRKAQYHETDRMGVVHHSNYIRWMEEARIDCMDHMGLSYRAMEEGGIISPVTALNIEYRHPVSFGDEVEVAVNVAKYGAATLEITYEIFDLTAGCLAAFAGSKHCFIKDGRIVSLKKALPEADALLRSEAQKARKEGGDR